MTKKSKLKKQNEVFRCNKTGCSKNVNKICSLNNNTGDRENSPEMKQAIIIERFENIRTIRKLD